MAREKRPGSLDRLNRRDATRRRNQWRRSGNLMEIREKRACRSMRLNSWTYSYVRVTDTSDGMKIWELPLRSFLMIVSSSTARANFQDSQEFVLEIVKFLIFYDQRWLNKSFHKGRRIQKFIITRRFIIYEIKKKQIYHSYINTQKANMLLQFSIYTYCITRIIYV